MTKNVSQKQKLLNALSKGKSLTVAQAAARWNIANVRARINDLRNEGVDVVTTWKRKNGADVAVYSLSA